MLIKIIRSNNWEKKAIRQYGRMYDFSYRVCDLIHEGNSIKAKDMLRCIFNHTSIPTFLIDDMFNCLAEYINNANLFKEKYQKLIAQIENLDPSDASSANWKWLSSIYNSNGLLRAGYLLREKAEIAILNEKKAPKQEIMAVLFENEQFMKVKEIYDDLSSNEKKENWIFDYATDIILKRENDSFPLSGECEASFNNYLSGKDVVLCGPVDGTDEQILFLEGKDVIVRMNFFGDISLPTNQMKYPATVSYYSITGAEAFETGNIGNDILNGNVKLDYLILRKNDDITVDFFDNTILKDKVFFQDTSYSKILYGAKILSGVLATLDLVLRKKGPVYVCRNNLYMTEQSHSKEYDTFIDDPRFNDTLTRSFGKHELTSQHKLLNILRKNQLIIPDEELENVLGLTTKDYISNMEKIVLGI